MFDINFVAILNQTFLNFQYFCFTADIKHFLAIFQIQFVKFKYSTFTCAICIIQFAIILLIKDVLKTILIYLVF